jgi:hypothetical protein
VLHPGDEIPDWCREIFDRNPDVYYEPEDSVQAADGEVVNYNDLTVPELTDLVKDRGLEPKSSKKADLVEALEAADAGDSGADNE